MRFAFARGRLLGSRYGEGPARVVGLPGWMRSHEDFDQVLEGVDALALDLPGFGASAPPETAWGALDYARVVGEALEGEDALLDERDRRARVVVGHSFGGRVALMLAASRPDLVGALVLSGVPLLRPPGSPQPRPAPGLRIAKGLHRAGLYSDERLEVLRRRSGPPDYRNVTGVMRDVFVRVVSETNDGTYTRALRALECSVALVWGALDTAAPVAVAEEALRHLRHGELTVVPGAGHLLPLEAPGVLQAAILRYA